jgi:hypothetical protein
LQNSFKYQLTVYDGSIKIEDQDGNHLSLESPDWEMYSEDFFIHMVNELESSLDTKKEFDREVVVSEVTNIT